MLEYQPVLEWHTHPLLRVPMAVDIMVKGCTKDGRVVNVVVEVDGIQHYFNYSGPRSTSPTALPTCGAATPATQMRNLVLRETLRDINGRVRLVDTRVAVLAEISSRSPRKLFIFIIKKYVFIGSKFPKK